ncbi:MAG: hypothetical protein ACYDHX_16730 [Methanothrix sp.]
MYPSYVDVCQLLHQLEVLSGLLDVYISRFSILLFNARASVSIPPGPPLPLLAASAYPRELQA